MTHTSLLLTVGRRGRDSAQWPAHPDYEYETIVNIANPNFDAARKFVGWQQVTRLELARQVARAFKDFVEVRARRSLRVHRGWIYNIHAACLAGNTDAPCLGGTRSLRERSNVPRRLLADLAVASQWTGSRGRGAVLCLRARPLEDVDGTLRTIASTAWDGSRAMCACLLYE